MHFVGVFLHLSLSSRQGLAFVLLPPTNTDIRSTQMPIPVSHLQGTTGGNGPGGGFHVDNVTMLCYITYHKLNFLFLIQIETDSEEWTQIMKTHIKTMF